MPALRGTEFLDKMASAARSIGWHPFPGPAAVNSRPYQNRSACMYHGFCNRGGCHVNAKNSTAVSTIPKAVDTGRMKVVTQAIVTSVDVDEKSGRIDIVITRPGDKTGASTTGLLAALLIEPLVAGTGSLGLSGSASIPGGGAVALQFLPAGITVR